MRTWQLWAGVTLAGAALAPGATGATAAERPDLSHLRAPSTLPATGGHRSAEAERRWIVAVRARSRQIGAGLARRHGMRAVDPALGIYTAGEVTAARFVEALARHDALWYAEPDVDATPDSLPADPLSGSQWWTSFTVPVELTPPPPGGAPVAVVDSGADVAHPDLAPNITLGAPQRPEHDPAHGTAVASIIGAPANGVGIVGVLPGQPVLVYPARRCSEATRMVALASNAANVINMSYGYKTGCFTHYVSTQLAVRRGALPVVSAGNELQEGNLPKRPAKDPHVLSVSAVGRDFSPTDFANRNESVDLVAAGVGIPVARPLAASPSGFGTSSGTSYSTPIVAGLASWVRRLRPGLDPIQTAEVFRRSAVDLGDPGHDSTFGFGLASLAGALAARKPVRERREPNEDIEFVTGPRFGQAPLLMRRASQVHRGVLHAIKDPVDVIPVRLRARSSLRVRLIPSRGNVNVEVFSRGARTVLYEGRPPRSRIAAGLRRGRRPEMLTVDNRARAARTVYLAITTGDRRTTAAGYRLVVRRRSLARQAG